MRRGRQKKRELVGLYGANKDTRSGVIDIAMLQSMGRVDEIRTWIRDYGMIIVDECHHVPAFSFEQVMKAVQSRYTYGLTATPKRQDGHHPILHMYLGPIRYHVDAKQQALRRPFLHVMLPRFTGARFRIDADSRMPAIIQYYDQMLRDDLRNDLIVQDVLECLKDGRNCLILSERTEHVRKLTALLRGQGQAVYMLLGGHHSPGGGFAGGAVLGGGLILYAAAFGHAAIRRFFSSKVYSAVRLCGLMLYAVLFAYYIFTGANGLDNHIPVAWGGLILPIDIAVGLVVASTMYGFYAMFTKGEL